MRMISLPLGGLALAGLLLGCASTPDTSGTLPPVTSAPAAAPTSATPTASPTPTLPPVPPEATENTLVGAQAFARYWFDVFNTAYETGDSSLINKVSAEECRICAAYAEGLRQAETRGEQYEGAQQAVVNAIAAPDTLEGPLVLVDLTSTTGRHVASDGSLIKAIEPAQQSVQMQLQRVGESWVAAEIVGLS